MLEYDKLVLESPHELVRGFLIGWSAARGLDPEAIGLRVLWPDEWDIRVSGALGNLIEAVRPGAATCVLVEAELASEVLAAMRPWGDRLHLRSREHVRSASFEFRYELYGRDQAALVRRIFTELPEGVNISSDYAPTEHSDPRATGVEAYAPAHAYVCRALGTVSGALRGVLDVHARCRQHERVQATHILLQLD